jgi:hypothetical protein
MELTGPDDRVLARLDPHEPSLAPNGGFVARFKRA